MPCPFCQLEDRPLVAQNDLAPAFCDAYPVNPGHTLIDPRRHVESWFDATSDERAAMIALADEVKLALDAEHAPDGFNLGVNIGRVAGQTVFHLHLHLIPRYEGDVTDPTGGIRNVIPGKGKYERMT